MAERTRGGGRKTQSTKPSSAAQGPTTKQIKALLSKPIAVSKALVGGPKPFLFGLSYCCAKPGGGSFGGGGSSGSWAVVTEGPVDYVPVAKAVAKLTKGTPCEAAGVPCLDLKDGRRVVFHPKGVFEILRSPNDKKPTVGKKAISAVMLLQNWTFEQAVAWMKKSFGPAATMNTAGDYLRLLVTGDL
jgi:hypothetical protein